MKLGNHSGKCSGHDDDLYTSFSLPTFLQFFTLMERERLLTRADRQSLCCVPIYTPQEEQIGLSTE